MPLLSAFTPCGMLEFSSETPLAERIYKDLMRAWGGAGNFDQSFDGEHSAIQYAHAMTLARALLTLRRAGNNADPMKATEMLPGLEHDYVLAPGPNDTLWQRREALSIAKQLSRGATEESVISALRLLLGTGFVAFRPVPNEESINLPTIPYYGAPGCWEEPTTPIKLWRTSVPIQNVGLVTVPVSYIGGATGQLNAGDWAVIEPGRRGRAELVQLTAATETTITATFTLSHDNPSFVRIGYWPYWMTNKRHNMIVVTASVVADAVLMRKVSNLMHKLLRGVSTWSIVSETSAGSGTTGPFRVGHSLIGHCTIGAVTI